MRSNRSAAAPLSSARFSAASPASRVGREAREREQLGAERHRHPIEARIAPRAGQIIDGVAHFDRVAGGAGERLVHVGDERDRRQAGVGGDGGDALGELARAVRASA